MRSRLLTLVGLLPCAAMTIGSTTRQLGSSGLRVTEACLGTMTYGLQNSEAEAHAQLDLAVDGHGINFLDCAEMYPTPNSAEGWRAGRSEEVLGAWLARSAARRERLVVATKVTGFSRASRVAAARAAPGGGASRAPPPDARLDRASVLAACDASLRRLRTDRIDLLQMHWPDRATPLFGRTQYRRADERADAVPIAETAEAVKALLDAGKIRAYGVSNENAFGLAEWVRAADELGMPRPASIQNSYSLLTRSFEAHGLAEACSPRHYGVGLLPWSVLCGGLLSGKFAAARGGAAAAPASSRLLRFGPNWPRWAPGSASEATLRAVDAYAAIAERVGITPAQLAILWCRTREFVEGSGSVIIGASTLEQLEENCAAFAIPRSVLDEAVEAEIDAVHMACRDPSDSL